MRRWATGVLLVVLGLALVGIVANGLAEQHWMRTVVAAGDAALLQMDAGTLEHQLRQDLPIGCSHRAVEAALSSRHLRWSYVGAGRVLIATARNLKGSNWLTQTGLEMRFLLDDAGRLRAIETEPVNTGP